MKPRLLLLAILVLGFIRSSMASLGHWEDWKEEVLLHDGRTLIVEREVFFKFRLTCGDGGSPKTFCSSPIIYRLVFENPDTKRMIRWDGEEYFYPIAIGIVDRVPYLVVTGSSAPVMMASYPECNGTPFFYYRYDESTERWELIAGKNVPSSLRRANLTPSYDNRYKGKTLPLGDVVRAQMLSESQTIFLYQIWLPRSYDEWQYPSKAEFLNYLRGRRKDCQQKFGVYIFSAKAPLPMETRKIEIGEGIGDRNEDAFTNKHNARSFRDCPTCPEMIPIPGKQYAMGKYEITQGEWNSLMSNKLIDEKSVSYGENKPVSQVSWSDARKFIAELNNRTGQEYRLPDSDEWIHACRAGENTKYCGGDDANSVGWHFQNSDFKLHEVGKKLPNKFGLYDMTGSQWELMNDCLGGDCSRRVIRGGSMYRYPLPVSDAYIFGVSEKQRFGFRLLRPMH